MSDWDFLHDMHDEGYSPDQIADAAAIGYNQHEVDVSTTTSKELDLDHIVPLKFAHGHGADKWSRERKGQFANDYDNLILVNASLNRQKGAKGPSEWLPPNHQYRCEYIDKFNTVMSKYELSYIPSEQRIINRMIKACPK